MSNIVRTDPKAEYIELEHEIDLAIRHVLESGMYILGAEVASFEAEFAQYVGVQHAVGVGSGTDALLLSLRACGIGPGDEVVTVSHTAVATVAAVELTGATPVLVDIDPVTFTMHPAALEAAITPATKAIIPVHLYGQPADLQPILTVAQENNLFVIEDCAQSHGAMYDGKMTGSWGHMAAFSFYPTKNLGAIGDGGMLVTNDQRMYENARLLRQYGWDRAYISEVPGYNSRLDPLQAAILSVKLRHLDEFNQRRVRLAEIYTKLLAGEVIVPQTRAGSSHVFHLYVIRCEERDRLMAYLGNCGVSTGIQYPLPVHLQPAYQGRIRIAGDLSVTERACQEILSLPMYPQLDESSVYVVAEKISSFYRSSQ